MLERLRGIIPKYYADKSKEVDVLQVRSLPPELMRKCVYGTTEEADEALAEIRTRERMQKKEILGSAAIELLYDMRAMYNNG